MNKINNELLEEAKMLIDEGFCIIPCISKEKHPIKSYFEYKKTIPSYDQLEVRFNDKTNAICVACGLVSGNLEVLDFDNKGSAFNAWGDMVKLKNPDLYSRLVIERSPSGGYHVAYRLEKGELVWAGTPLAKLKEKVWNQEKQKFDEILIEILGEGDICLIAPSENYHAIQGEYAKIATITKEERMVLFEVSFSFNEIQIKKQEKQEKKVYDGDYTDLTNPWNDYCNRANFHDLITKYGWKFFNENEKNAYYTRPGKETGISAAFDGKVFLVFSSNAAPFEIKKGYNKAMVFMWLVCGGDPKKAYQELVSFGYGKQESDTTGTVGIEDLIFKIERENSMSGIEVHEVEIDEDIHDSEHKPIAKELLDIGGFIGMVADYTYNNAPVSNKVLSFVGALALMAHLIGRKVRGMSDIRSNLYLLGLGGSSSGKDYPRKVNTAILAEIDKLSELGDKFASGEGLEDALFRSPCLLMQTDEINGMLENINMGKESRYKSMETILLSVYSYSDGKMPMRQKSGREQISLFVNQPSLTLLGTAVPQYFYEAISEKMFNGGLLGRMLVFEGYQNEQFKIKKKEKIPQEIIDIARYWRNYSTTSGNLGDAIVCEPHQIEHTSECDALIDDFGSKVYKIQKKYEKQKNEGAKAVWGRAVENVLKLSLIRACSDDYKKPLIDVKHTKWAIELVEFLVENIMISLDRTIGDNPIKKNANKLASILLRFDRKFMTRREVYRKLKVDVKSFEEAIKDLLECGTINVETKKVNGSQKPTLIYFHRNRAQ